MIFLDPNYKFYRGIDRPVEAPEGARLDDALLSCKASTRNGYDLMLLDEFISGVAKDEKLASTKVKGYLATGASSIVFETEDGDVLKLTRGNHFPLNRPHESFDVPIKEQGRVGKIRYYVEEKLLQHGLSDGFVQIMKDRIRDAGYRCSDLGDGDIHQIGMSKKGELYLLDPECAKYKTIFHALFDKVKRFLK